MCLLPVVLSATDAETIETVLESSQDFFNSDMATPVIAEYVKAFAMGFALATLFILVTYGMFKALSLLHI